MNLTILGAVAFALVAATVGLAAGGTVMGADEAPLDTAQEPLDGASTTEAGPPASAATESGRFDLLRESTGHIEFTLPGNTTGNGTATLEPTLAGARSDRSLCVTLERTTPSPAVIARKGQCGSLNVNVQTNLDFGTQEVARFSFDGLSAGTYRLGYEAEPQAAKLALESRWGS